MVDLKRTLAIHAFLILVLLPAYSQSDEEDSDCWCKHENPSHDGSTIGIRNVDSLSINANPKDPWWRLTKECEDGEGCEGSTCKYERKTCRWINGERICTWNEHTGECTIGELGGGDIPWDTTGVSPGNCNCISIPDPSQIGQVYLNIDKLQEIYPGRYIILDACNSSDCEGSCQYLVITPVNPSGELKEGFCTEYWPEDSTIVEPDTIISSPPLKSFLAPSDVSSQLFIFPNPTESKVHLRLTPSKTQHKKITIVDLEGREVYELTTMESEVTIQTDRLTSGIYIIQSQFGEAILRKRLIIK